MERIRNIYCVGRNYALHAQELNNEVPTSPFLFMKPTHALVEANGQTVVVPKDMGSVHYEIELVIHIGRPYERGIAVDDLVDQMALGIDFTLRDQQTEAKKNSHPWLLAKGFPNSAVLTPFVSFPGVERCKRLAFALQKNGEEVQRGSITDLVFDLQTLVDFTAKHLGLGPGDILFTGTPAGVGPVADGDELQLVWDGRILGDCCVRFS